MPRATKSQVALALAIALCATLSAQTSASNAGAAHASDHQRKLPEICEEESSRAAQWKTDLTKLDHDGTVIIDNKPIVIRGPNATWETWDAHDPAHSTQFHSMTWLIPGLDLGLPVVDILLEREQHAPDPGASEVALTKTLGWTAGVVRLRMGTVACLYRATRDPRLPVLMEALVQANTDPWRYPGPPQKKAHNKGALANLALIEAARVFNRPDWFNTAQQRLTNDITVAFDTCGMSREQSSTYHLLNLSLWNRALTKTSNTDHTAHEVMQAVRLATRQLTRPDGILEAIGTGHPVIPARHMVGDAADDPTFLYCDETGWAANRTHWEAESSHYTLRFGPRAAYHGHDDRGSLTWYSHGVPVFSDRGVYDRIRGPRWDYARSAQAHSTFTADGITWPRKYTAAYETLDQADSYKITTSYRGARLERNLTIELAPQATTGRMRAQDVGSSNRNRTWVQRWQLSEGWIPLMDEDPAAPVAVHPEARLHLHGTCQSEQPSQLIAERVETYPGRRQMQYAYSLTCRDTGKTVTLTTEWHVTAAP